MKTYTGTKTCEFCGKDFTWEYLDDGYRPGMKQHFSSYVMTSDPLIAKCKRYVAIPNKSEYLIARCPYCNNRNSIECNENMMKELNS